MRKFLLSLGLVATIGAAAAPAVAGPQGYYYYHHHHRYWHACRYQKHRAGAIGAVAGAIGGGIIGSAMTHGGAGGTLLGAGAGALTGNAVARGATHC